MKLNMRWQFLLALLCLTLVLALLSFQVQTASLCSTRVPADGGTLVEGVVGAPRYINPLLSDLNPVDSQLVSLIFDGLTRYNTDGELEPALATEWAVSEDGRTVTFTLREDVRWHDGEEFTAEDVLFTYRLLQNDAFPAPAGLHALWQEIEIGSAGDYQVTFTLPEPYAALPGLTSRGILPAHLLAGVDPADIPDDEFNLRPVGTGPFEVDRGTNWQRRGYIELLPNETYWPDGIKLSSVEMRFYPENNALLQAYAAGEVQAINNIAPSFLPQYIELPGLRLYSAPTDRMTQLIFNLSDTGAQPVRQREVRQALAQGLDRENLVDEVLNGQGLPLEGPYLPSSWAYNESLLTHYGYDPVAAAAQLDAAGWTLPEGTALRQNQGTPLTLRLLYWDVPPYVDLAERIATRWEALGVRVEMEPTNYQGLRQALAERRFDAALVDVAPVGDPDLYDFWSQEAVVRGQNYAGWNNRRASEALEAARQVWSVDERRPFYETFLSLYNEDLPALTLYQHVYSYGISEAVREVDIGRIDSARDRYDTLANWFMLYRNVTIGCPGPTDAPDA